MGRGGGGEGGPGDEFGEEEGGAGGAVVGLLVELEDRVACFRESAARGFSWGWWAAAGRACAARMDSLRPVPTTMALKCVGVSASIAEGGRKLRGTQARTPPFGDDFAGLSPISPLLGQRKQPRLPGKQRNTMQLL